MNLLEFIKIKVTDSDLIQLVDESIHEEERSIISEQKKQWDKGEDKNGNSFPLYSQATEIITRGRKRAGTPFNLKDTGAFRRRTGLITRKERTNVLTTISSSDSKRVLLEQKIGRRIFGLQNKNMDKTIVKINNKTINKLNKRYKL